MDRDEKIALKAACVQAAAMLIAGLQGGTEFPTRQGTQGADTGNCARYARDLFGKLTNEPWDENVRR